MNEYSRRLSLLRPTYELQKKNDSVIVETTAPGSEPRTQIDPLDGKAADNLLLKFLRVKDAASLLKYAERFDLPNRSESHSKTIASPLTSTQSLVIWRSVEYYLGLAAMLRWLVQMLSAVRNKDDHTLESWIRDRWIPIHRGNLFESSTEVMVRLKVEPKSDSPGWNDWNAGGTLLAEPKPYRISRAKWNKSPSNQRLDCASAYLADQINALVSGIRPALTADGKQYYAINEPLEAMCLRLYYQFAGASGIVVCRNPNCPKKFYLPKPKSSRKGSRKPRSDRRYCDIASCQSWAYDNLGRVRSAQRPA